MGRGAPRQRRAPDRYVALVMDDDSLEVLYSHALRRLHAHVEWFAPRCVLMFIATLCFDVHTTRTQWESCACERTNVVRRQEGAMLCFYTVL